MQRCVEPAAEAISGFCFSGFTLKKGLASCPLWLVWVCFGFWLIYPQARRSYYLFFSYLFFNYMSVFPFHRRVEC